MERHLNLAVATEVDLPSVTLNLFTFAAAICCNPKGVAEHATVCHFSNVSGKLLQNPQSLIRTHLAMLTLACLTTPLQ